MSTLLVDTNVVSFIMKKHALAADYRPLLRGSRPAISFMTVAELYEGAYQARWGRKLFQRLELTLQDYALLQSSLDVAQRWGEVRFQRRQQPISVEDAWIAATALVYDCPLVTHNPADFRGIRGLRIVTAQRT